MTYGLCMVLFIAGAQSIPSSLYDAARVDGAGAVREFFAVTLPALRNQVVVAFVLTTINALRSFDIIYNTTSGGPGTTTYVPSFYMYRNAFVFNRVGYAAAIAVILTAAIFTLAGIVLYVSSRGEEAVSATRVERVVTYTVLALFAVGAIYPVLSILFLGAPHQERPGDGLRVADRSQPLELPGGLDGGRLRNGPQVELHRGGHGHRGLRRALLGTGYAFGTMRFRGDRWLFGLFLLGIIFPYEATVIPLYYDFQDFGILNTYWSLILPQIGQSVAFGTFWMRAFFRSTPPALVEAARMDGASSFGVLVRVLLPQARPAVLTLCALVFTYTWNEFLLALVLVSGAPSKQTAPLGLSFFAGAVRAGDPTKVAAASVLVAAPIVIVYIFLQRHFIRGMLAGAVKG